MRPDLRPVASALRFIAMTPRLVNPELLDHLPAHDPEAMRSRRDLRRINFLMGNERWICRTIGKHAKAAASGIVELGAGTGELSGKLATRFPEASVTACDLAPRPPELDGRVVWKQGDVLTNDAVPTGGVLVANLFLHHFQGESLAALGRLCNGFEVLVFTEPDRNALAHVLGTALWPVINRVTRHDMHVSIHAGFTHGELPDLLGLDRKSWLIEETSTWRGARRVLGWRA
jgi:hypothetical protein